MKSNMYWVLCIIGGILLLIPSSKSPDPPPKPDDPKPIVITGDLWDTASSLNRKLVADVLNQLAFRTFNNDEEKLKHIETEMTAARMGAYGEVNKRLQEAMATGPEAVRDLSEKLAEGKLK